MEKKKIDRINELYHKSKKEGLTEGEKAEQAALRIEYRMTIMNNLSASLNNVSIKNPDGTITKIKRKGHEYEIKN